MMKLNPGSIRFVIPSRGRHQSIANESLRLFPQATLFVHESEAPNYRQHCPKSHIETHAITTGIGAIRQQMFRQFDDECIVNVDDDLQYVASYTARALRKLDPPTIEALCYNAAELAYQSGTCYFGFNLYASPNWFKPTNPFHLKHPGFQVFGIIGREIEFDPRLKVKGDVDIYLQAFTKRHFVIIDERIHAHAKAGTGEAGGNTGGNRGFDGADSKANSLRIMSQKWGAGVKDMVGMGY